MSRRRPKPKPLKAADLLSGVTAADLWPGIEQFGELVEGRAKRFPKVKTHLEMIAESSAETDIEVRAAFETSKDPYEREARKAELYRGLRIAVEEDRKNREVGKNWREKSKHRSEAIRDQQLARQYERKRAIDPKYSKGRFFKDTREQYGLSRPAFFAAIKRGQTHLKAK